MNQVCQDVLEARTEVLHLVETLVGKMSQKTTQTESSSNVPLSFICVSYLCFLAFRKVGGVDGAEVQDLMLAGGSSGWGLGTGQREDQHSLDRTNYLSISFTYIRI